MCLGVQRKYLPIAFSPVNDHTHIENVNITGVTLVGSSDLQAS
jgi:hypothetical protein